jgi:hypothetical protein
MPKNRYSPPSHELSDPYQYATDATDIYADTLPPQSLKLTGMSLILTGIVVLFMALRIVLSLSSNMLSVLFLVTLVGAGLLQFLAAWGIPGGRTWLVVVALVLCPIVAIASVIMLLFGFLAGLGGAALAIVNFVLLLVNWGAVRKIAHARAAMRRLGAIG